MSKLNKNFYHALDRMGTYMHGQTSNDRVSHLNVTEYRYKKILRYCDIEEEQKYFDLKVRRDIGRFEIMNIINNEDFSSYFNEIPKINDKFGGAYTTHLFLVKLGVPK